MYQSAGSYAREYLSAAALTPKFKLSSLETYYIPDDRHRATGSHRSVL